MKQYKKKRQNLVNKNDNNLRYIQERKSNNQIYNDNNEDNDIENNEKYIILDDDEINEEVNKRMVLLIKNDLSTRLLAILEDLNISFPSDSSDGRVGAVGAFPTRAGSHLNLSSPQLEFVKALTHVLGLDSYLTIEVTSLKSKLIFLIYETLT
jgi:hypothetical protein